MGNCIEIVNHSQRFVTVVVYSGQLHRVIQTVTIPPETRTNVDIDMENKVECNVSLNTTDSYFESVVDGGTLVINR